MGEGRFQIYYIEGGQVPDILYRRRTVPYISCKRTVPDILYRRRTVPDILDRRTGSRYNVQEEDASRHTI